MPQSLTALAKPWDLLSAMPVNITYFWNISMLFFMISPYIVFFWEITWACLGQKQHSIQKMHWINQWSSHSP